MLPKAKPATSKSSRFSSTSRPQYTTSTGSLVTCADGIRPVTALLAATTSYEG